MMNLPFFQNSLMKIQPKINKQYFQALNLGVNKFLTQNQQLEQQLGNKDQLNIGQLSPNKQMKELCQDYINQQSTSLDKKIIKNIDFIIQNQNNQTKNNKLAQDQSNQQLIKSQSELQTNNIIRQDCYKKQEIQTKNAEINQISKQSINFQYLRSSLNCNLSEKVSSILFRYRMFDKKSYLLSKDLDYQQKLQIEKQLSKDLNIFEFYKDILFLKKAIMILLTSEQLSVLRIIGCSSNFLEEPNRYIFKDSIKNNNRSLNYFQKQYYILENENLQFEKVEQFFKKRQQNNSLTQKQIKDYYHQFVSDIIKMEQCMF
ncbi:hypothetical protein ABPG72_022354 [Tetrahymena utriculariae]